MFPCLNRLSNCNDVLSLVCLEAWNWKYYFRMPIQRNVCCGNSWPSVRHFVCVCPTDIGFIGWVVLNGVRGWGWVRGCLGAGLRWPWQPRDTHFLLEHCDSCQLLLCTGTQQYGAVAPRYPSENSWLPQHNVTVAAQSRSCELVVVITGCWF